MPAFTKLVGRYLGIVREVGRRRTGNRELADEIAQNVFTALARKAADLPPKTNLAGWLHRAAVLESAHALRSEYTRRKKLQQFAQMKDDTTPIAWDQIRPELDGAINQLGEIDRDVVMMRFIQERTLSQIGRHLGKSESATQRHLQRALGKLCAILRKRGITTTTAGLGIVLGAELGRIASTGLLASEIATSALASKGGGVTAGSAVVAITTFTMTKTTITITIGLLLAAVLTTGSVILGKHQAEADRANAIPDTTAPIQSPGSRQKNPSETRTTFREAKLPLHELMEKIRLLALSDGPKRITEIEQLFGQLEEDQMPEALAFLTKIPDSGAKNLIACFLYKRWGALDGASAVAEIIEDFGENWARHDSKSAMAWFDSLEFENRDQSFKAAVEISEPLLESDPATALDWLWPKVPEPQKEQVLQFVRKQWTRQDQVAADEWLRKQGYKLLGRLAEIDYEGAFQLLIVGDFNSDVRQQVFRVIFKAAAAVSPDNAYEFWKSTEARAQNSSELQAGLLDIFREWGKTNLPEAFAQAAKIGDLGNRLTAFNGLTERHSEFLAFAANLPPSRARTEALTSLLKSWSGVATDLKKIEGWLAGQEFATDVERAELERAIAEPRIDRDPESAAAWLLSRATEETYSGHLGEIVDRWSRLQPDACAKWLRDFDLGPQTDEAVARLAENLDDDDPPYTFE